jgi:hypothetical protein
MRTAKNICEFVSPVHKVNLTAGKKCLPIITSIKVKQDRKPGLKNIRKF